MKQSIKRGVLIALGWLFVALGLVGIVVPLLPTTPLLIVALMLFSNSSPRFHQMLRDNRWFGPGLRQWEASKSLARANKIRATVAILITFSVSLAILHNRPALQMMLVVIGIALLIFLWRIREPG